MKPFIVIHCKTEEEKTELLSILEKHQFRWNGDNLPATELMTKSGSYIYLYKGEFGRVLRYADSCDDICFADFAYIKDDLDNILH